MWGCDAQEAWWLTIWPHQCCSIESKGKFRNVIWKLAAKLFPVTTDMSNTSKMKPIFFVSDPCVTVHGFGQSFQESADFDTQKQSPEAQGTRK